MVCYAVLGYALITQVARVISQEASMLTTQPNVNVAEARGSRVSAREHREKMPFFALGHTETPELFEREVG